MYQIYKYYKLAFCHPLEDIISANYLKEGEIDFHYGIPMSDNYIFNGPMKIKTSSDLCMPKFLLQMRKIKQI